MPSRIDTRTEILKNPAARIASRADIQRKITIRADIRAGIQRIPAAREDNPAVREGKNSVGERYRFAGLPKFSIISSWPASPSLTDDSVHSSISAGVMFPTGCRRASS